MNISNKKMLTVIIPCYNSEDTIKETIESVEKQTSDSFKILIIDDGSTDNGKEIVNKLNLKYKNIDYVYKENGGVSSARNLGIKLADTDYVSFLDSDDLYHRDFVKSMLENITKDDADVSFCSYYMYYPNKMRMARSSFKDRNIVLEYLKGNNSTNTNCFVISRNFLIKNNIEFDDAINWGEDIYFFLKCMAISRNLSVVKDYLTYYRRYEGKNNNLSNYDSSSLEKDKIFIYKILNDSDIILNTKETEALLSYRLPALLTYGLLRLKSSGTSSDKMKDLYNEYKDDINRFKPTLDLRSIKLLFNIIRLKLII